MKRHAIVESLRGCLVASVVSTIACFICAIAMDVNIWKHAAVLPIGCDGGKCLTENLEFVVGRYGYFLGSTKATRCVYESPAWQSVLQHCTTPESLAATALQLQMQYDETKYATKICIGLTIVLLIVERLVSRKPKQAETTNVLMAVVGEECPVCAIAFKSGDDARQPPCKHLYHKRCFEDWKKRSEECPMCRADISA